MWPHLGRKWASIYVENARVHTPFVTQKNLKEKSEPAESHTTIWKGPKFKFKLYWTHSIETRLLWTRLYYHVESHLCLAEAASGDFYLDLTHFFWKISFSSVFVCCQLLYCTERKQTYIRILIWPTFYNCVERHWWTCLWKYLLRTSCSES